MGVVPAPPEKASAGFVTAAAAAAPAPATNLRRETPGPFVAFDAMADACQQLSPRSRAGGSGGYLRTAVISLLPCRRPSSAWRTAPAISSIVKGLWMKWSESERAGPFMADLSRYARAPLVPLNHYASPVRVRHRPCFAGDVRPIFRFR